MIIYFEGLSCAGKTELIRKFLNYFQNKEVTFVENILCISEIVDKPDDYNCGENIDRNDVNNLDCLLSDEKKSEIAKKFKGDLLLVDRGYASTLAYNYIDYKLGLNREYLRIKSWYKMGIKNKSLVKPDIYIYIKISANTSLKRSKEIGRYNQKYAWYREPQFAIEYYDIFFGEIENNIPLIIVDGERNMKEVFRSALNQFLAFTQKRLKG